MSTSVLLSGGTIIAFNAETEDLNVIRNGSVLVTHDRIAAIHDTAHPSDVPAGTELVDCTHKIISPGFIDTHRHGWQTALKTLSPNTNLADYLHRYIGPDVSSLYTAEDVYIGQLAGLLEALNAGVTTTLDHAHHTWSTDRTKAGLQASIDSGARVYWSPGFGNIRGDYSIPDQIADFKELVASKPKANDLTTIGVAYDMWTVASPDDTQAVIALAKELEIPVITTHYVGGVWPRESSPELLHSLGMLDIPAAVVFSHAAALTPTGARLLRETNQFVSITPESEMHYGHGHLHAHLVQDQAALGVDTHLAFSSDMLTQARLWLQRTRSRLYDEVLDRWQVPANNPMSVVQAFQLATRHGGLALRRPDLGVIAPGAKADLVVFDGRSPGMLGWVDPVAAVVLHAGVGDMVHVMVDGKFRKRDGKLTFQGYDGVVDRFLKSAEKIQDTLSRKPAPVLEGRMFGITEYGRTREVNTKRGEGTGYGTQFLDRGK
ncbi:amidohydrolase family protein [Xylariaceae sp. FL0662B]|nr:amidohydrolase family protein [Xylariaceae sp. FL0662B]